jgi:cytochrome c biogenesis protein CcdA/thiol-disulfide isomerase/thioredoxin
MGHLIMIALILFAVLAGLVTVLSPCILPVLPILLAAGVGQGRYRSLGIILGLIISFSFFTLALTALVHATGISPDGLRYIAIAVIIICGLMMLFPALGDRFAAMTSALAHIGSAVQEKSQFVGTGFLSGCIVGIALGLIWTPCAGPILATITTLVASSSITLSTIVVTLAYSTGAAIPMFLISYGGNKIINSTMVVARYTENIRRAFGLLMILGALAIAFHVDVILQQFTLKYFPMVNIENNEAVTRELGTLKTNQNTAFSFTDNNKPEAPAIVGIQQWLNSAPLSLEQLRGKVVLIDFWTYSCINCVRTLPHVERWYNTYKDAGFVIIGVHTPEFEFEKNVENVKSALQRFGITYPVALDNKYATWKNYNNHYWPAHYLIDQNGIVQEHHFGEGDYTETENAIRKILGLAPLAATVEHETAGALTPETYLGYARAQSYHDELQIQKDQPSTYDYHAILNADQVGLKGVWQVGPESIQAHSDDAQLNLNFTANRVYLVMRSPAPQLVNVLLDGQAVPMTYRTIDMNAQGQIQVSVPRMYDILNLKGDNGRHVLTLEFPKDVSPYVFTFGAGEK